MFNSFILRKKRGGKQLFLQFKLNLIQYILQEAHIDVDIAEAGHDKYVSLHYPELIAVTENKDKPQKRFVVCTKDGRRKVVDINAKYVQTTLVYVLPHSSKNIVKNKIEGVTEH